MDRRARVIAASLLGSVPPGERALLLYPPGLEFVVAFFGCLYAGVIAVPAYPPRGRRPDPRIRSIARDCGPRAVLTTTALLARRAALEEQVPELAGAAWLDTESPAEEGGGGDEIGPGPGGVAFLQYTSGSTGTPKGVVVTHANLLHNLEMVRRAFGQTAESVVVGWLPLFHDMGLIGNVLEPCYVGSECVLMSPAAFLQKPVRWLEAIQRFGGTTSGGPNFAYDLCARTIGPEAKAGLDLSSWEVAFDGSEPVRAETLRRFAEAFAPCGFRREAFFPCYGLAEATLFVAGPQREKESHAALFAAEALTSGIAVPAEEGGTVKELVSCGASWMEQRIVMVDPESGVACEDGRVGEIWLAGPSVADGYWNRLEESAVTFGARLGAESYLRTGDLGFLSSGELFVTGRLKDLIILRGRNLYPNDLEQTAERSHPALRAGGGAAFSVEEQGEERLVLVYEVERHAGDLGGIADAIRRAVAEEHGVPVAEAMLVREGTIPKTSSGKIRRGECRTRYLGGDLAPLFRSARRSDAPVPDAVRLLTRWDLLALDPEERAAELLAWLRAEIGRRAGADAKRLDPEATLAANGLDSLMQFDLQGKVEADLGLALSGHDLSDFSIFGLRDRLLDDLASAEALGNAYLSPFVVGEPLGDHPLSPGQEALWFLERSGETEGVFHLAAAARLGNEVDGAALWRAAVALSERHPSLRTTFTEVEGEPYQRVHARLPPDLAEIEARTWSPEQLADALQGEARRGLDLAQGSPLRIRVFARPGGERVLLWVLHHLVGDFWSLAVLMRDWAALYAAERDERRPALPDLPVSYADFVRRHRRFLQGPDGERLESYWLDRLRGAPLTLQLPTDRPRPPVAAHQGALLDLRLDRAETEGARELGRAHGTTLFATLLAAWQALLGRLTGQDDFLVGAPTTGRRDRDLAGVVGYFVNPVVLRADLSGEPSVADFLARTRRMVAEALENRDLPFPRLARLLQPTRDPGGAPVFQVLFVLQQAVPGQDQSLAAFALGEEGARFEREGLVLESLRLDRGTAQLDLTLSAAEVDGALGFSCEYDTALFDRATIGRWLGYLRTLLALAVVQPARPVEDLPFLGAAERHQLLREWSDTAPQSLSNLPGACLHDLFEAQARRTPEAVAVVAGTRELRYREIDRAADRLAGTLRRRGIGAEDVVGIFLERSADLVISLLAVLKAGAAYLPLDPALPRLRLSGMVAGARIGAVVSDRRLTADLPWNGPLVWVDGVADEEGDHGSGFSVPARSAVPENLAYVLYTSGSTGAPKGVAVTHRSAVELVRWAGSVFAPEELAGVLAATALSFDLSVFELFVPLSWGGAVILAQNVMELPSLPLAGRVTLVNTVPSAMSELIHAGGLGASIRTVNLAGEALQRSLVDRLYATGTVERVWNLYGPSEDTTYSTYSRIARESRAAPNIGRPITATEARVLGGEGRFVPRSVAGELHLGGAGLARGYLHRPDLTAERFVPDPFATEAGARLYRTGDRVRWTAAGELEFLGRIDRQVKLRGFRIELGEIELALDGHPAVAQSVACVRDERDDRRLVAYLVLQPGQAAPGGAELRARLRGALPEYMVPAEFVVLKAFPLTLSGKVDRRALPAPEAPRGEEGRPASRTPIEEVLAGIWGELLGLERIGAADHFFDLGGHSLLAMRVLARLRGAFGVELSLRDLFEAPRLEDLAARVEAALATGPARAISPLVRLPRSGPLPLSFAQARLWFIDRLQPGSPLYNIPVALRVEGPLDARVLALCLGETVRRHEVLRTAFVAVEGAPVQAIRPPEPFALPEADLSGLAASRRETLASVLLEREAARPFDLGRAPLLRGVLLRLADEDRALALTLHHIVGDGWSLGLLVREIEALYSAFLAAAPSPLAELPLQYADYAGWQRLGWVGEVLDDEISFWRRQLAGLPPRLELPTDRARPATQSHRGALRPVRLPADLTRRLETLGRREGATLFMTLLAGFQALLARYSGQRDLAVGTPVAGRNRLEIEGLIGFFVNTLVLRGDLSAGASGEPSMRELIGRVREAALAAHSHQEVPFEKLVQELSPERSLAQTPLFQVMLALQNVAVFCPRIEGLSVRRIGRNGSTAKFDLTLDLERADDGSLAGSLEYATELFDAATLDRFAGHFELLLSGLAEAPERRFGEVDLLGDQEKRQLLAWNDTAVAYPLDRPLHAWIEAQADRRPGAVAIAFAGEELTYRELDLKANRLAHRLRAGGCGAESRVGVLLERSCELLVALLGILKAGAAYVPLDPEHPADRLAYQERDARLRRVVTRPDLASRLPSEPGRTADRFLFLEHGGPAAGDLACEARPGVAVHPDNPAYVLYTSGSTGKPKGAMISHRAIVNRLLWMQDALCLTAADRVMQKTPFSFDVSVWELFWPLMVGARLVVALPGGHRDNAYLVELIVGSRITVLHFVPSMLQLFLDEPRVEECTSLREVVASGEALPAELAVRFAGRLGAARLHNLYGPTEAAVDVTFWVCGQEDDRHGIPIGRPIANTTIHLLGPGMVPVPVGVSGELFIGGVNLARGYVDRPDLTAERFLPDPAGGVSGGRLYRTGDLARRRADGAVDFLGRLDHQVKVRGFRIELGEIEAVLTQHPGVQQATVIAYDAPGGQKRLVAYSVAATDPPPAAAELRSYLAERLPAYMVPALFVALPALPLSPNGKVDRAVLPAPDGERAGSTREYLAPRTGEEQILAEAWAQILHLPSVGVNDNFFELGGDSILSIQIVARARRAGLLLTVRQVFEHQTVAELARHAAFADGAVIALADQGPVSGAVPLTPIQSWFFEQGFAAPHHFNQALSLAPSEPLVPAALARALAAVVEHHDALRLRFIREERTGQAPLWRQENAFAEPASLVLRIDLSGLPRLRQRRTCDRAAAALHTGFDLSAGPLIRLAIFEYGPEPPQLLWLAHHLVVDGVSWRILLEDLAAAYGRSVRGLALKFPPKTTSFRDWARRLAEYGASGAVHGELDRWLASLRPPVERLPTDFPRDGEGFAEDTFDTEESVGFELTEEETSGLLQTVPTIFRSRIDEALLAGLACAAAEWTGVSSLRVDLEGHGREPLFDDLDVSRTVGWFTTLYPVVLEAGGADPGSALVSAKERLRAVPARGIGYGLLRYLGGEEDGGSASVLAATPAAEISFNYLGRLDSAAGDSGLFRASPAASRCPHAHRPYRLDVSGSVVGGRLRIAVAYGSRVHRRATVEHLAVRYCEALRQLVRQSRECAQEIYSPADFPQAALDALGFGKVAAQLEALPETGVQGIGRALSGVDDIYPLSPLQEGMLLHSLMAPETGVYVNQLVCTLSADLDPCRFRQAWQALAGRHGALRTDFVWEGLDRPLQVIHKRVALPWRRLDLRGLSEEGQRNVVERCRRHDRYTALDLRRAPLLRFTLIRLDREFAFVWTYHHLLLDGWSVPLLVRELALLYVAAGAGRAANLPPVRPFGEYVAWLERQDPSRAEPYWRRELSGFSTPNQLGVDRPARASGHGEHEIRVSRAVTAGLHQLAARHKVTLQIVTLGAWAVLVGRYCDAEDVVFGNVVAGRPAALPGVESMVGMFINTLPVRARLRDAEPLAPWLRRLQEHRLAQSELEHSPLVQIQRWSEVPAGSALFETLCVFENYPALEGDGPSGLGIADLRSFETTNYPITLVLMGGERIPLRLLYDRVRLDDAAAPRLLRHLESVLAGMAEGPDRRLGDLSLLSAEEALELRAQGEAVTTFPPGRPLHALIEERVDRTPQAIAVICEGEGLSYRELDDRANRLARRLRSLGVETEVRVAVLLPRSADLVVALLAVLKAGGAYVPLDPGYPAERLAFLLSDSGAAVLVTAGELNELPAVVPVLPVIRLDADRERIGRLSAERLAGAEVPASLAYVIYTSGSTGRPKGVQVTHANVARLFAATEPLFRFGPGDVWTFFHSYAFDFSVWEIWGALLYGGRLVVVPYEVSRAPESLLDLLVRERVTVLNQTPSAFAQLARLDEERGGVATDLAVVIFGGEALEPSALAPWFARHGDQKPRLVNMYGITETTVHVTFRPLLTADARGGRKSVIGAPIQDLSLAVLDRSLRPAAIGVAGELVVGGAGLARGYLGRPDLTAERFVPDSVGDSIGARLYRSGDLGRHLAGRDVEYLGRIDQQVKIRGFRIEPGEVEAALARHPAVRAAAVVMREDSPGDRRLVGYFTVRPGFAPTAAELRGFLRNELPEYMVPAAVVALAELPLTPNGKLDRRALPAPDGSRETAGRTAPRSPTEQLVAMIWSELLGIREPGVDESFFDLGGHSLLATRLVSRLRETFGAGVPLRTLFDAPTVAALAAALDSARLPDDARQEAPPIARLPGEGRMRIPLSFAQQRLWFLEHWEPGRAMYTLPGAVRLRGPLRVALLAAAVAEIVRRHESLRTTFGELDGEPVQVIRRDAFRLLTVADLAALAEPAREAELARLSGRDARRGFDLERGPLYRLTLVRLRDADHALLAATHHIVSDAWSMSILIRELGALYRAGLAGMPSPLPGLPVQYADFAGWQRRWFTGARLDVEMAYWRRQLAGAPPVLELPADRPRPPVQSYRGERRPADLSEPLAASVEAFGRREHATPFMVLLAGFQALLMRLTGRTDVSVGTPVAGRNRLEIEGLIGFFVNTLVLRTELAGDPRFGEIVARVRALALDAYAHQDLPFEKLVDELAPDRSLGHSPLIQVAFSLNNIPEELPDLPGVEAIVLPGGSGTAKFDLVLELARGAQGFRGVIEYATDLFDAVTIARFGRHLARLLAGAMASPELRLSEFSVLSEGEEHQLLLGWNDTGVARPAGASLDRLFATQVERTPDAVAVVADEVSWSYRELSRRANRLAWRLRRLGVGPEVRVAVCLERSPELVLALYGILAAGGAYVPLDPDYPRERLAYMLADARPAVLISSESLLERLPPSAIPLVRLDREERASAAERADDLPGGFADDLQLAYMIYTSGSTGRPKGAMVSHRAICNRLLWMQDAYRLSGEDAVLQKTPFSFDVSVWEFFWPLLAGARLVVARPGGHRDGAYLVDAIAERAVTVLHFVPSMLRAFLEEPDLGRCGSLRKVVASGEALGADLAQQFFERLPVDLENLYGPTEAAVDVTVWGCRPGVVRLPVPIGRPVANTAIHVLDPGGLPVPIGVTGELHIGGTNVGRGYLARPGLTAEKFVPDPFGEPGARLYRTGDLARVAADGAVEFLGRIDHQVKLRGFRIELGEIETALARHPQVGEAVLMVREDAPGDRRLVGYVTVRPGFSPSAAELRGFVREELPEHMVPAAIVFLAELPLTPNGKLDRRALQAPEKGAALEVGRRQAPRTPTEKTLAAIWEEVLGIVRISADANFFDLGGHSLLGMQVVSRARRTLGVAISIRNLFETPTLAGLAAACEKVRRGDGGKAGRPAATPLSSAQRRLWQLDREEPGRPAGLLAAALRVETPLPRESLERALDEIRRRHESLRTVFVSAAGEPAQEAGPATAAAIGRVDLDGLAELSPAEARRVAGTVSLLPFDLAQGPFVRTVWLRLAPRDHTIVLQIHRIVGDEESLRLVLREMAILVEAFAAGRPSPLTDPPVQYADFVRWQAGWLSGSAAATQLAFWKLQLADLPLRLSLSGRPRPETGNAPNARSDGLPLVLSPEIGRSVRALATQEDGTPFMVLLAAWQIVVGRQSGREEFLVGWPVAGRVAPGLEGAVGCFETLLPLCADLSGAPAFREVVRRVRAALRKAQAHRELPFEQLVVELWPGHGSGCHPLVQAGFDLAEALPSPELPPGFSLLRVAPESTGLDLFLRLGDDGEGFAGSLLYGADLFASAAAERLVEQFRRIVESVAVEPSCTLADLSEILADAEAQQRISQQRARRGELSSQLAGARRTARRMPAAGEAS